MIAWYNGFSPQQRAEHIKAVGELMASGELAPAAGRCDICGDPDTPVEYHCEDYGKPYKWNPPATYTLCRHCHRHQLHARFQRPELCATYLAHVRRGGYGRDLKNAVIKLEFQSYRRSVARGETVSLRQLRPYAGTPGTEWFTLLRMDVASLRDLAVRPR